ncbi:hypothetical protein [Paenibacillus kobensis]|uniref:hypothetical protein n=1 Tax=Paenibacillus kobensis TaxID=59841 RepID=UPI000FD6EE57|nr:hypothetical protein [Paenibacillus kobensis]
MISFSHRDESESAGAAHHNAIPVSLDRFQSLLFAFRLPSRQIALQTADPEREIISIGAKRFSIFYYASTYYSNLAMKNMVYFVIGIGSEKIKDERLPTRFQDPL